ncbi:MAG: hypothetical protein JW929_05040 [Anaerolineales bacterium]|nr:hypothetical protein [Anaerolineales bacterium]
MVDPLVRRNHSLVAAGLAELLYGGMEIGDTFYLPLFMRAGCRTSTRCGFSPRRRS